jgi:hypothetical protein
LEEKQAVTVILSAISCHTALWKNQRQEN